jgi:hypothetical protein
VFVQWHDDASPSRLPIRRQAPRAFQERLESS